MDVALQQSALLARRLLMPLDWTLNNKQTLYYTCYFGYRFAQQKNMTKRSVLVLETLHGNIDAILQPVQQSCILSTWLPA